MVFDLSRREFLLLNVSAGVAALLPNAFNEGLSTHDQRTLLAMARTVFPHDTGSDRMYKRAVALIDARCRQDPAVARLLSRGLSELDWSCLENFATASEGVRVAALKPLRGSRF